MKQNFRKAFRFLWTLAVFTAGVLAAWTFWLEPRSLLVQHYSLTLEHSVKIETLRIGIASDIHLGRYYGDEARLQKIVALMNGESPDLIVFLGDYIAQKNAAPFLEAAPILKKLKAPLGVYAILGNHDWWSDKAAIAAALEQNGVKLIDNQIVKIQSKGQTFQLAGFGDYWEDRGLRSFIAEHPKFDLPTIGLTHNPDIFPDLDPSLSLLLAGHTHGGQVNFPIAGSPIVPSKFGERYRYGMIHENGHHLLVTSGTGNSILPVRFRVPPEIVVLDLSFR